MRSPEELLKEFAKPALDHTELVEIARTASSNTEAKNRALVFTKEQGLDEQVAMSCRWLKILHDQIAQEEFEQFMLLYTNEKEREMPSQTTLSKTEQYNLELNALCNCADPGISSRAKVVKDLGFDPTRIEKVLGISFENFAARVRVCAHCPMVNNFVLDFDLRVDSPGPHSNYLIFEPMGDKGFSLNIDIRDLLFDFKRKFWIDKIDVNQDSVVLKTTTFIGCGWDGVPDRSLTHEVVISREYISNESESCYIVFRCETNHADSWVAQERLLFGLSPISK